MAAAAVAVSHGPKLASDSVEELQEELREELMNTYSEDIGKVSENETICGCVGIQLYIKSNVITTA